MANPNPDQSNLKPFKKGKSGNPNGRPPKLVSTLIQELKDAGHERVGATQITETYELLTSLSEEEIRTLVNDKKQPMIVRIVGKAMLSTRGFEILERMLDRAQGRPKQSIDADVSQVVNIAMVEFLEADDGNKENTSQDTK